MSGGKRTRTTVRLPFGYTPIHPPTSNALEFAPGLAGVDAVVCRRAVLLASAAAAAAAAAAASPLVIGCVSMGSTGAKAAGKPLSIWNAR